jgi:hypothetical protein
MMLSSPVQGPWEWRPEAMELRNDELDPGNPRRDDTEETTRGIDTRAVNVAAGISKVALICQCSRDTRGMPRSRKRAVCESKDKLLPLVPRAITALGRQAHFLKKLGVSRVIAQIFE